MTGRDTPSRDPVLPLLHESGISEDPALIEAVETVRDLAAGPAPDASAELAQLMADGGRARQSRRHKRRVTFIGGALAVSMGVGMSGVAAGTLHLPPGIGTAVESIARFSIRDGADRAEYGATPQIEAGTDRAPTVPAPDAAGTHPTVPTSPTLANPAPGGPAAAPGSNAGSGASEGVPATTGGVPSGAPAGPTGSTVGVPASASRAAPSARDGASDVPAVVVPPVPLSGTAAPDAVAATTASSITSTPSDGNGRPRARVPDPVPPAHVPAAELRRAMVPGGGPGVPGSLDKRGSAPGTGKGTPAGVAEPRGTIAVERAIRDRAGHVGRPGLRRSTHPIDPDGATARPTTLSGPPTRFRLMAPVGPPGEVVASPPHGDEPWSGTFSTFAADPWTDDGTWSLPAADAPAPFDPAAVPGEGPADEVLVGHVADPVEQDAAVQDVQVDALTADAAGLPVADQRVEVPGSADRTGRLRSTHPIDPTAEDPAAGQATTANDDDAPASEGPLADPAGVPADAVPAGGPADAAPTDAVADAAATDAVADAAPTDAAPDAAPTDADSDASMDAPTGAVAARAG